MKIGVAFAKFSLKAILGLPGNLSSIRE